MKLLNLQTQDIDLVAGWLADEQNHKWLSFGHGVRQLSALAIKVMLTRDAHCFKLFTATENDERAIGLVALSEIDPDVRTATLWYLLGDKRYAGAGHTSRAVTKALSNAFHVLHLGSVHAWTVEGNIGSQRVLERNGFRFIGRLRCWHHVDGVVQDRLLYDLLPNEHSNHMGEFDGTNAAPVLEGENVI